MIQTIQKYGKIIEKIKYFIPSNFVQFYNIGNGDCVCGNCQCNSQWTGNDCSCSKAENQCLGPYNSKLCSGHGQCKCNQCNCDTDTNGALFTGLYCEKFPGEPKPCKLMAPHVECKAFKNPQECLQMDFNLIETNLTSINNQYVCEAKNENGCNFR